MKEFQQILKEKRDYYGNTEAAIEFAANEYVEQFKIHCDHKGHVMTRVSENGVYTYCNLCDKIIEDIQK